MHYIERMAIEIEVTPDSSFCPGVDRAFRITEKILFGSKGRCFSVGPLIHNPEVVRRLEMLGLGVIEPGSGVMPDLGDSTVVIRSHGIDIATEKQLEELGAVLVDATCPSVKRAQDAARELLDGGCAVLVLGSASHPEVLSIVGRAGGPVNVIQNGDEARSWLSERGAEADRVGIVCQTTIPRSLLEDVLAVIEPACGDVTVMDTICDSVARRIEEATELARRVDMMIVAGGRNSSNTAQLAARCQSVGVTTHLIEDSSEIRPEWLEGVSRVGVTGGASTPDWLITETLDRLRELSS
jgi:(E)-4-hydroxy-3-methyl-but-2-enyl pyrophosphate reductase